MSNRRDLVHRSERGLTRVALDAGALVVNSSQQGGGKDTWVWTDVRGAWSEQEPQHQKNAGEEDRDTGDSLGPADLRFVSFAAEEAHQRQQEAGQR